MFVIAQWVMFVMQVRACVCVYVRPHPCYQCVADIPRPLGAYGRGSCWFVCVFLKGHFECVKMCG